MWAPVCFAVQCGRLLRRCPACKHVMGPVDPPGMGPLSRGGARCRSRASRMVRCRGDWRRRPCGFCVLILPSAGAELAVRSVGAHWFAGPRLAVAASFRPAEGVAHRRDTLEGLVLWSAGLL